MKQNIRNKINWNIIYKDSYMLSFEALVSPSQRTGKNGSEKSVINRVILDYYYYILNHTYFLRMCKN